MRVSVVRGGGFSGLIRTTTADMERLSPGDRQKLAVLVRRAGLFDPPTAPNPEEPEPDRFTYTVTVEDERQRRKIGFSERSLPEGVRNLISWVSTEQVSDRHAAAAEPRAVTVPLPICRRGPKPSPAVGATFSRRTAPSYQTPQVRIMEHGRVVEMHRDRKRQTASPQTGNSATTAIPTAVTRCASTGVTSQRVTSRQRARCPMLTSLRQAASGRSLVSPQGRPAGGRQTQSMTLSATSIRVRSVRERISSLR